MLCGKTPLTHTSAWQLRLSYSPWGCTGLSHGHCNDLKGQTPQQSQATPTGWTALWEMEFGSLYCVMHLGLRLKNHNVETRPKSLCKNCHAAQYKPKIPDKCVFVCIKYAYECVSLGLVLVLLVRGISVKRSRCLYISVLYLFDYTVCILWAVWTAW